jgi:hypothetical protein
MCDVYVNRVSEATSPPLYAFESPSCTDDRYPLGPCRGRELGIVCRKAHGRMTATHEKGARQVKRVKAPDLCWKR